MENEQLVPGELDYSADAIFSPQEVIKAANGVALYKLGTDSSLNVQFYHKRVPVPAKSTEAAIVWEEKVYVRIERPGDKSTVWDRPAKDKDKIRFAFQWQKFLNKQKTSAKGTPIEVLYERGLIADAQLEMLRLSKINTIQQLAAANTAVLEGFGSDGRDLQKIAKGFLNLEIQMGAAIQSEKIKEQLLAQQREMDQQKKELDELRKKLLAEIEGAKEARKEKAAKKKKPEDKEDLDLGISLTEDELPK